MIKRRFSRATGLVAGIVGCGAGMCAGAMIACAVGAAMLVQIVAVAGIGAMLFVLAMAERGAAKSDLRARLMFLGFLWLAVSTRLPLLEILEAPVLPIACAHFRQKGDGPHIAALCAAEALLAAARTLALTPLFGAYKAQAVGAAMILAFAARLSLLVRLLRRERDGDGA